MENTRAILFFTGTTDIGKTLIKELDWGNICFTLFYASKVDPVKAGKLLRLIFGESVYGRTYNIEIITPTEDSQFIINPYNALLLQEVISFLEDVFAALMVEAETYDDIITEKYGGVEAIEDKINTGEEMVTNLIGCLDEYFYDDTKTQAHFCLTLKEYFQAVLNSGTDFEVELD